MVFLVDYSILSDRYGDSWRLPAMWAEIIEHALQILINLNFM